MTSTVATKRAYKILIDGEWFSRKETLPVENPATREVIAEVPQCAPEDIEHAVRAARIAFESGKWHKMTAADRGRVLFQVAHLIRKHADTLAELETLNTGRPVNDTRHSDIPLAAECFEYYAGLADKQYGETGPFRDNTMDYSWREPLGVIAQITPWRLPLLTAAQKLAPALAAGNTIILNPSCLTPLTTLRLGELLMEAGLPTGVVNIITGKNMEIWQTLAVHPGVDMMAFAGETTQGKALAETASHTLKKVSLQLEGRFAGIVFNDAHLDTAVEGALSTMLQGHNLPLGSRLFVQEAVYEDFVKKFTTRISKIKVSDPTKATTEMGSLINREQREKFLAKVERLQKSGGKLLCGGHVIKDLPGYFVEPTVFSDIKPELLHAPDEHFGPLTYIQRFKEDAEAVRQVNEALFGFTGCLWTQDLGKAHRIAKAIKTGVLQFNSIQRDTSVLISGCNQNSDDLPGTGLKGLARYTREKHIYLEMNEPPTGRS